MPTYVTGIYDKAKLEAVKQDINRAILTIDSLIEAMEWSKIEEIEIAGVPELKRGLKAINSFGNFGHDSLREIRHAEQRKATPGSQKLPPKPLASVGDSERAGRTKKARKAE